MCKYNFQEVLKEYRKIYNNEDGVFQQLKKLHKENPYTVEDHVLNNSKICFIFSCPGREELIQNKVCSGETGENLDELLKILGSKNGLLFPSSNRYDYDILNASNKVHFYALDKKTEANKSEIKNGFQRISAYIEKNKNLLYIILFGKKAQILRELIDVWNVTNELNIHIISAPHLGYQSLNQIGMDIENKEINEDNYPDADVRTQKRLEVVAKDILIKIK